MCPHPTSRFDVHLVLMNVFVIYIYMLVDMSSSSSQINYLNLNLNPPSLSISIPIYYLPTNLICPNTIVTVWEDGLT